MPLFWATVVIITSKCAFYPENKPSRIGTPQAATDSKDLPKTKNTDSLGEGGLSADLRHKNPGGASSERLPSK